MSRFAVLKRGKMEDCLTTIRQLPVAIYDLCDYSKENSIFRRESWYRI